MISLCCGQISTRHFEALLLFALQLDRQGYQIAIDARFAPSGASKQQKYEMAPFLAAHADIIPDTVILIGAETISEDVQHILGAMQLSADVPIHAVGHFSSYQDEINACNRIAYATGLEPHLLNLSNGEKPVVLDGMTCPLIARIESEPLQTTENVSRVLVYIPSEDLEADERTMNDLSVLGYSPDVRLHVLTNAKGKEYIRNSRHAGLSVFSYAELPPGDLLHYFDILVFFGPNVPGERMAVLATIAMAAGKVVIDCTTSFGFVTWGAPVLKGPLEPAALPGYLQSVVSRNRLEIGSRAQINDWLKPVSSEKLTQDLNLGPPVHPEPTRDSQTIFFPTNGNGMGHAQRCALIADAMSRGTTPSFAAFPSCVDMLHKRGFACLPLVPRSADHTEEYAADLVNFLRLRNHVQAQDQLVFDGGYVFDSVYRLISSLQMRAIWIRRGLWRPGQISPIALERERAFAKVIVPEEAFSELNSDYSQGQTVHKVGPIVRQNKNSAKAALDLRDRLRVQFDQSVETLVVTMLGGGVASERTAQTQLLCSVLERRKNCLHLIVAWPNAVVSSGLYGWKNSHVIHTAHTLDLCKAADVTVSAAGYNSFHEILYADIPAILIPQSAPYLDDQEGRARAAYERGLVGFVQEDELLGLEREISAFLDEGKAEDVKAALRATDLPTPGNLAAAALVEERD